MENELTLTARWIFPVDGPPLLGGTIAIAGKTIVAVQPAGTRKADIDLGNVAILPGFVNAHTHLDLSDAAGKCPPTSDFTAWLRRVIAHRRQQTSEQVREAIAFGIRESLRFGVTSLGDISAQGASWDPLAAAPIDAIVYREAIGLSPERATASFERVSEWFESRPALAHCRAGISPHAPYTVGRTLFEMISAFRARQLMSGVDVPLAIHFAETRDELELLANRTGRFVPFLQELGVYDGDAVLGDLDAWWKTEATFIHANYAEPRQVANREIVYCPRTHAAFGHAPYPLREFLNAGATVLLGTDSLASNPDLNVLAEARHVWEQFPDLPGEDVVRMLTARQRLAPGHDATIVVQPLPNRDVADPHCLVFDSTLNAERVMLRGAWR